MQRTPGAHHWLATPGSSWDDGLVPCLSRKLRFPILAAVLAIGLAAAIPAQSPQHGLFEKPFYNGKTNYSTRGGAGAKETTLYMMEPERHLTGIHDTVG